MIDVTLETEDPRTLEPEEALGNIIITDEKGAIIRQKNIWVDDWLAALVNGAEALGNGEKTFSADIQSEPNPILFQAEGKHVALSFANATVTGDLTEFRSALRKTVRQTLAAFHSDVRFHPDSFWAQLQQFAL